QQADGAVELVHGTQCGDPGRVLCDARAVAQPSGTVVACTGNDGGKSIADDETPFQMPAWAGPCRPMPSLLLAGASLLQELACDFEGLRVAACQGRRRHIAAVDDHRRYALELVALDQLVRAVDLGAHTEGVVHGLELGLVQTLLHRPFHRPVTRVQGVAFRLHRVEYGVVQIEATHALERVVQTLPGRHAGIDRHRHALQLAVVRLLASPGR